jgi:hypothetical protein
MGRMEIQIRPQKECYADIWDIGKKGKGEVVPVL